MILDLKINDIVLFKNPEMDSDEYIENFIYVGVVDNEILSNSKWVDVQINGDVNKINYCLKENVIRIITEENDPEYFL